MIVTGKKDMIDKKAPNLPLPFNQTLIGHDDRTAIYYHFNIMGGTGTKRSLGTLTSYQEIDEGKVLPPHSTPVLYQLTLPAPPRCKGGGQRSRRCSV